jgi:hypothetical protein
VKNLESAAVSATVVAAATIVLVLAAWVPHLACW